MISVRIQGATCGLLALQCTQNEQLLHAIQRVTGPSFDYQKQQWLLRDNQDSVNALLQSLWYTGLFNEEVITSMHQERQAAIVAAPALELYFVNPKYPEKSSKSTHQCAGTFA